LNTAQKVSPDEVLVLNINREVLETEKLYKNPKFGNNLLELANKIKNRNVQEDTKITAVYKNSGDGEIYLVDEVGKIHNLSDLKEGASPNLQNLRIPKKYWWKI